jgi:bifunctional ADP-heptose synthase (sugar kinase/adenylyltransferase)
LDTRSKIVGREEALARIRQRAGWVIVTGYFDPVTAAHVRRLRQISAKHSAIAVFLSDPSHPILPAQARAELLAAMRMVDCVVLPQECASQPLDPDIPVFREEEADVERLAKLIEHVHERHNAAAER